MRIPATVPIKAEHNLKGEGVSESNNREQHHTQHEQLDSKLTPNSPKPVEHMNVLQRASEPFADSPARNNLPPSE